MAARWLVVVLACSLAVTFLLGTAPSAHAASSIPTMYGGMDLRGYCQAGGYATVTYIGSTYYDWRCVSHTGSLATINMRTVCAWQYNDGNAQDYTSNFYTLTGGRCFHGIYKGLLDLRGYCLAHGAVDVQFRGSTINDWYCVYTSPSGPIYSNIYMQAACQWQYGTTTVLGRFENFYVPTSEQCWQYTLPTGVTS